MRIVYREKSYCNAQVVCFVGIRRQYYVYLPGTSRCQKLGQVWDEISTLKIAVRVSTHCLVNPRVSYSHISKPAHIHAFQPSVRQYIFFSVISVAVFLFLIKLHKLPWRVSQSIGLERHITFFFSFRSPMFRFFARETGEVSWGNKSNGRIYASQYIRVSIYSITLVKLRHDHSVPYWNRSSAISTGVLEQNASG